MRHFLMSFTAFVAMLSAQSTHVVGPGGLPEIRDALAIAVAGDRIDVLPGTYAHFSAGSGVTIRAVVPGTVTVAGNPAYFVPCGFGCLNVGRTMLAPGTGNSLHLVGLHFVSNSVVYQGFSVRHRVEVVAGRVTFDDCRIDVGSSHPGLSVQNAVVHLQGCTIAGVLNAGVTVHALEAQSATVTAAASTFTPSYTSGFSAGGNGLSLVDSVLHGSQLTVNGSFLGEALAAVNSSVWVSDSAIVGGPSTCPVSATGIVPQFDRCTFSSSVPNCPTFPAPGFLLGVERPAPLQSGSSFQLRFRTQPNLLVAILASPGLDAASIGATLEQPLWLPAAGVFAAGLLPADNLGSAVANWQIPSGVAGQAVWFVGICGVALPLQASPVVGGVAR